MVVAAKQSRMDVLIEECLTELEAQVVIGEAERAAREDQVTGPMLSVLDQVSKVGKLVTDPIRERLGEVGMASVDELIRHADLVRHALAVTGDGDAKLDTEAGNALVLRVKARVIESGYVEEDDDPRMVKARDLIDRWSKGTGTGGAGRVRGPKGSGGGIALEIHCACGWHGFDSTGVNSARWNYTGHLLAKHDGVNVRPAKGDAIYTAITEALTKVYAGEVEVAFEGGKVIRA